MIVTFGSGNARKSAIVAASGSAKREAAILLKRYIFPTNGAYHKAKRRGVNALGAVA